MVNKINKKTAYAVAVLGAIILMVGCGSSNPTGAPAAVTGSQMSSINGAAGCRPINQPIYFSVPGATLDRLNGIKIFAGLIPTLPDDPDPLNRTPQQYAEPVLSLTSTGAGSYQGYSPLNGSQISLSYYTAQNQSVTSSSTSYLVNVNGTLLIGAGIQSSILRQFPSANVNSVCLSKLALSVTVSSGRVFGRAYLYVSNASQVGANGVYITFTN